MAGWKIPYSNNGALVRWENHRTIAGWFSGASLIAALAAPGAGRRWFITNTSIPQNGQHGPPRNENWTLGWWFFSCLDLVIWCHSGAHPVYIILMSWNLCLLATGMLRIEHDWTNNQNWRNLHSDLRHHWQKRQNQHTFWMFLAALTWPSKLSVDPVDPCGSAKLLLELPCRRRPFPAESSPVVPSLHHLNGRNLHGNDMENEDLLHSHGKSLINGGFNGKIIYKWRMGICCMKSGRYLIKRFTNVFAIASLG